MSSHAARCLDSATRAAASCVAAAPWFCGLQPHVAPKPGLPSPEENRGIAVRTGGRVRNMEFGNPATARVGGCIATRRSTAAAV